MEYYESRCIVCGHRWSWIGYKTAMGKTPAQIAQMNDTGKTCPVCGGTRACYERRELEIVAGIERRDVLDWILAPLSAVSSEPASPKVPFQVGQTVHIHKFGWNGADRVVEVRGEHVRIEGMLKMFDEERPLWFHYTELRSE